MSDLSNTFPNFKQVLRLVYDDPLKALRVTGSLILGGSVRTNSVGTRKMHTLTSPATPLDEFSQVLDADVKRFRIAVVGIATIQWSTKTGTEFENLGLGGYIDEKELKFASAPTIFIKCDKASKTITVTEWK